MQIPLTPFTPVICNVSTIERAQKHMGTEIKTWEIRDGSPIPIDSKLSDEGRTETVDLESWIESDPSIVRPGMLLIGRQVMTSAGPLDLLAVDRSGDLVVIELKRDKLPREALVQAIDYASDLATWSIDKISETCMKYTGETLEDLFSSTFSEIDVENTKINDRQRISWWDLGQIRHSSGWSSGSQITTV